MKEIIMIEHTPVSGLNVPYVEKCLKEISKHTIGMDKGFTLIEVIIALSIISIIMAVLLPQQKENVPAINQPQQISNCK